MTLPLLQADLQDLLQRLNPYHRTLRLLEETSDANVIPCHTIIDVDYLREVTERFAAQLGTDRLIPAASLWSKYYDAAAMTGVIAAMTLEGVGLNVSSSRVGMLLQDGLPMALCLDDRSTTIQLVERRSIDALPLAVRTVTSADELRRFVLQGLFADHLAPFVEAMAEAVKIHPRILWANIGSRCAYYFELFSQVERVRAVAAEDREALLGQPRASWTCRTNPLYEPVRFETYKVADGSYNLPVRKTCCLRDQLPDAKMCGNCPRLSNEGRLARLSGGTRT